MRISSISSWGGLPYPCATTGVDYGDYIEQLTYLLFLKMADERGVAVPKGCGWATLKGYSGNALTDHYSETTTIQGVTK